MQSPLKSEGHYALRKYLQREDMIAIEFSRRSKVSPGLVSMLLACEVPAGKKAARKIRLATDGEIVEEMWQDRAAQDPLGVEIPRRPGEGGGPRPRNGRLRGGIAAVVGGRGAAGRWEPLDKRDKRSEARKKLQIAKARAMEIKRRRKTTRKTTSPERQITCLPRSTKSKRGDGKSQGGT